MSRRVRWSLALFSVATQVAAYVAWRRHQARLRAAATQPPA